jgi:3-phenylpropionate/trans-cinnamate dioxygenase ferredoxin reductase subunit
MTDRVVVVGAGHAGGSVAAGLAAARYPGEITLVGSERYLPYQRPPLSKDYLTGTARQEGLLLKPAAFFADRGVDLYRGVAVERIERDAARVVLSDGGVLDYSWLVLCTGAAPRRLAVPGVALDGVLMLRTIEDSDRIAAALRPGARVVIVGGGYIGLELAAAAVKLGVQATVLERASRVLARTSSPEVSAYFARRHQSAGVEVVTGVTVDRILGNTKVMGVATNEGQEWLADVVIIGVGAEPEQRLAEAAGLGCNDGIIVDEHCRTNDPRILAAGDCTRHTNGFLKERLRLESVQNATGQARTVVAEILGRPRPYAEVPWFWSDQYETRLQIAGVIDGERKRLVRGDPSSGCFSVLHMEGDELRAIEAINRPQDFIAGKRLITERRVLHRETIVDPETPLYPSQQAAAS